jgi:hypothetical protein
MAFANAANRRIAAHLTEGFDVVRQQKRLVAHTRGRQSGFRAGMTAANDDYVKLCGIKHRGSHAGSSVSLKESMGEIIAGSLLARIPTRRYRTKKRRVSRETRRSFDSQSAEKSFG